jgi:hypothetical protein
MELPVLLDLPAPRLRAYPRETVIAEKLQAMVMLGLANTRMKDFYDIWALARAYEFTDERLARAIAATFARRGPPFRSSCPTRSRAPLPNNPESPNSGRSLLPRLGASGRPSSRSRTSSQNFSCLTPPRHEHSPNKIVKTAETIPTVRTGRFYEPA